MNPNPVHRLPPALESAVQRLKLAARDSTERTIESLGLAALASNNVFQRDSLLGAQFELNRKSAIFVLAFNEDFDRRVLREVGAPAPESEPTGWDALSLVEDREVELQVSAERFGLEIAHACEWELRELGAYVASLLGPGRGDHDRNPLRPEIVGHAMLRAVESLSDRADVRKVLTSELARSLGSLLRNTYAEIVADLRDAGVKPVGLTVRTAEPRGGGGPGGGGESESPGLRADALPGDRPASVSAAFDSHYGMRRSTVGGFAPSTRSGHPSRSMAMGQVDPAMMSLIRRLAHVDHGIAGGSDWGDGGYAATPLPNLIRAHRDELRQASTGSLDHLVIDVIGTLFDQILADPKVPPQMARQIARLQLPVLRAALGDPSFFSSRKHPVRRFVNRIASLGAAFEDFTDDSAQRVFAKVRELVQQVVEGDFDQIDVYERQLQALEAFVAELGRLEVGAAAGDDAAELLSAKEDEARLRTLYAQQLQGELKGLAAPAFVRDFISNVWSQVLLRAAAAGAPGDARVQRLRAVGRELFMSVQPKTSAAQRKVFLAELPKLMKELGEGMDLVGWPEASRRAFFGQLLPAHAEALKAQPARPLDINMLARQVDTVLDRPLPSRAELKVAAVKLPVLDDVVVPPFSAAEAARVGLVDESAVDWNARVDIDLSAEPPPAEADARIDGLPAPADAVEPTEGKSLADHVQIGFAYQMHLDDEWQKVRLVHISPGRTFFVFHRGSRHKRTISLTQRMLVRLCETGRLRAYESAYLLERATARARRQLAGVGAP